MSTNSPLIPELYCEDIEITSHFYMAVLGFSLEVSRPEDKFAIFERQGTRMMFEQLGTDVRKWISAPLEKPFGRGISFQIDTTDVDGLYRAVNAYNAPVFLPIEEKWYRQNNIYVGNRQFIVQDPDGYLLRFAEDMGERPSPP